MRLYALIFKTLALSVCTVTGIASVMAGYKAAAAMSVIAMAGIFVCQSAEIFLQRRGE